VRTVRALRRGFDVVHLHEPFAPSITIPALLGAGPMPVVGTFHAAGQRTPYRWLGRGVRPLARRISARVAVSEEAAALARRHLGGSYEIVGNGVDLSAYALPQADPLSPEPLCPEPPAADADGPVVLFLGRHEPRKGLAVLLDAAASLPPGTSVWVAGDGPATRHLRERQTGDGRVVWLGRLSEADKVRALQAAAVLCAPSLGGESFGVVLLEAMASGTPVVASDLPGYRSAAGEAAVYVPPGDAPALAEALGKVVTDASTASALRVRGRARATAQSMDRMVDRYEAIYERVLAGGASESIPRATTIATAHRTTATPNDTRSSTFP
jgi:phosphatidylinositol alpha-mannosyltransferase